MEQLGFFDTQKAFDRLSELGDPLETLDKVMDWRSFEKLLNEAIPDFTKRGKGGRPPYPNLMKFKITLLRSLYNLSFEATEYLLNDRMSWHRFVGLAWNKRAPDCTEIRHFEEQLEQTKCYQALFELFNAMLEERGLIKHEGSLIDASFVDAPRRRNTSKTQDRELKAMDAELKKSPEEQDTETATISPELDKVYIAEIESDLPQKKRYLSHQLAQTDTEARWAKKGEEVHFGYKNHVKCDTQSKLITAAIVTPANVTDVEVYPDLIDETDRDTKLDAGYVDQKREAELKAKYPNLELHICSKAQKNKPLTDNQKATNTEIARIRARIEHIFGRMTYCMGGLTIRSIGIHRACRDIVLKNLAYNMLRFKTLVKLGKAKALAS
jgi:IS5 family transposase